MTADLEQNTRMAYSSASSTRTIPNDDPVCTIDEESKKVDAQKVEKDTAVDKVEDAGPPAEVGENPDGGLKAWLVVIGVSALFRMSSVESGFDAVLQPPCSESKPFASVLREYVRRSVS